MKPLEGIRILDLTRVVSGPFCTMILADLGAEVIKIEEPAAGDESRAFGPPFVGGESAYFLSVNRGKKSCGIDLKTPEGLAAVEALAREADVLVENFRPGTLARLGLGPQKLAQLNDRLIVCSISGFGSDGPDAQRPGYDLIIQGESGIMDITGFPDGPPRKIGTSEADLVTGLYAVQAILAAILKRERGGGTSAAEVSMLDAMASLLTFNAGMYFTTGNSPTRRGNAHPTIFPYETFRAADGWINVGVANDKFWQLFCRALALGADVADDPRFATAPQRVANRKALRPLLEARLAAEPRAHWLRLLEAAGVPCGSIRTVGEVCEAPQLTSRGMLLELDHPTAGKVRNISSPHRFDGVPLHASAPPPLLGEHTREVLRDVAGIDAAAIAAMEASGAVSAPRRAPGSAAA
jgi:crotonobetainyl-CoA:carnitine CoA-transferase CaiB-like acyl-CoA transferase